MEPLMKVQHQKYTQVILHMTNYIDAGEVRIIHDQYEGIQDISVLAFDIAETKEVTSWRRSYSSIKHFLLKNHEAKLWLAQELFIWAERTWNWNLHLIAIEEILKLFAATGLINMQSSRLYLQLMQELSIDHSRLYHCFTKEGFHSVHRSSRNWAGWWIDFIIEQVMMQSIKSQRANQRQRCNRNGLPALDLKHAQVCWGGMMLWQQPQIEFWE